ncbi:MAG: MFS transporter [Acidimicrobiales bacterium]
MTRVELASVVKPKSSSGRSSLTELLDEAPLSRFHRRAVIVSGIGFFTDAYDLFVISTVSALTAVEWHLSTAMTSWVTGAAVLGAFVGALVFGRMADLFGRKRIYVAVAAIMVVGALLSATAQDVFWLIGARFLLGLGIGGDYPVSAVLMSEYSNRKDRGRNVGLVFSMQALGLVVGPIVALGLLASGLGSDIVWRLLLAVGAIPAGAVVIWRSRMPESPRFLAQVQGRQAEAARQLEVFSGGQLAAGASPSGAVTGPLAKNRLGSFLRDRTMLRLLLGTAGGWLLFDYAYYGNTLSLPSILKEVSPTASLEAKLAWTLGIFVVFAVPGYILAFMKMDRIGHRRLQIIGFSVMAIAFGVLAAVGVLTTEVAAFLPIFGLSYFFIQFGPNSTTFVLAAEVFPVEARTTGHGIAAALGKLGAFIGVFLVPVLENSVGLRGMLLVAAASAILGLLVTLVLPEPARRSLEEVAPTRLGEQRSPSGPPLSLPERLTASG